MVSIQVTGFGCGGVAIGLSVSHRIVDAGSISTFISAWAEEVKNNPSLECVVKPIFYSPALLPFDNLCPGFDSIQLPRTVDPDVIAKRFVFNKDTIENLKAKVRDGSRRVSKVGVVCALISKAMIHVDRLKHDRFRSYVITQVVNIRDRAIPPFPKHSCGNLTAGANLKLRPSNDDDGGMELRVGFEDMVSLLHEAVDKTIADCASLFSDGGLDIVYGWRTELVRAVTSRSGENKFLPLSDLSKFEYYEADFGWGKPIWTCIATMTHEDNFAVLMGNKEGDGIEAWVHLFKQDMALFEQEIVKI